MVVHVFRTLPNSLRPVDDAGAEWLAKQKLGTEFRMEVKRDRSNPQMRMFWSMMHKIHGTLREDIARLYPTTENLVDAVKIYLGCRDEVYSPSGEILGVKPGSIAFKNMDRAEFNDFMDKVVKLVLERFMPGMKDADLRREIEGMILA